jgi:hypothetical protein
MIERMLVSRRTGSREMTKAGMPRQSRSVLVTVLALAASLCRREHTHLYYIQTQNSSICWYPSVDPGDCVHLKLSHTQYRNGLGTTIAHERYMTRATRIQPYATLEYGS